MPEYRRAQVPGGTFFITIVTYQRSKIFINPRARELLHQAWLDVEKRFPFITVAICLLPDHIHALITLPEGNSNFSIRIREIKRFFTKAYLAEIGSSKPRNQSRIKKDEATVWQRRFFEHTIRDGRDLETHINYIHYNPVKHGLVDNMEEWKWSSFHRYVKNGFYPENWGGGQDFSGETNKFGE